MTAVSVQGQKLYYQILIWEFHTCYNTHTHLFNGPFSGTTWVSRYTHIHTHPFNGPFSGTTQVSQYQKGKSNLDFTEARDSEWQWHQQICKSASRSRQITTPVPHHSVFYRPDALPVAQPTASKHWRHWVSRYLKGKTNLDLTGARDSDRQWYQLGHMQVCTLLQTNDHASTPPLTCYKLVKNSL